MDIKTFQDQSIASMNKAVTDALEPVFDYFFDLALSLSEFDNLLTQADAARQKGCSRQAIQRAIRKGKLPTYTRYRMVLWQDVMKLKLKGMD